MGHPGKKEDVCMPQSEQLCRSVDSKKAVNCWGWVEVWQLGGGLAAASSCLWWPKIWKHNLDLTWIYVLQGFFFARRAWLLPSSDLCCEVPQI